MLDKLPDIKNGFVVIKSKNKVNANNRQTRIKSALIEYKDDNKIKDIFYTGQECLAEKISNNNIFSIKPYIYRPLISEKGLMMEERFFPISLNVLMNSKKKLKNEKFFNLHIKKQKYIKKNFKEIHYDLLANKNLKDLYLNICFILNDRKYSLINPVTYINFSPISQRNSKYIQIIQGDFYIKDNSQFSLSYIALFISNNDINFEIISKKSNASYFFNNRNSNPSQKIFSKLLNQLMSIAFPIRLNTYFKKIKPKIVSYEFFNYY